ncbi:MAG: tetratricopeptide repeat protein, partial [Caenispirillum sp.]|nr:tetratricopeptide repeat protein [Caenispirillum sp.]
VKAFEQAVKRGVSDAATWAALGEALVAVNQGQVTAPAAAAFRNTLRKDRDDPRARYYLGLARVQQGDAKGALAVWRDLEQSSPADAPWVPMIQDAIRQVATQAGIPPISVTAVHPLDLPDAPAAGSGDAGAEMRSQADAERAQSGGGFSDEERQMIQGMVGGLAERLKENPDDFAGWMRLGQSYVVLKQPGEAAEAYGNAVRLQPGNLEALRNLANAQALTAKEQGAEQPPAAFYETLRRILTVEPRDTAALKLVGEYEAAQGNAEAARELWTRLRDLLPEGSLERAEAERRLQSLGS